ncbi:MAG: hypothetical protein U0670_09870 [Anaerolineae bacterium]
MTKPLKPSDFNQLVNSMRADQQRESSPTRQQQYVDLILKGTVDPLNADEAWARRLLSCLLRMSQRPIHLLWYVGRSSQMNVRHLARAHLTGWPTKNHRRQRSKKAVPSAI